MNVHDPAVAQQIVTEYARLLERHAEEDLYPASISELPYPKVTIREALESSVRTLVAMDQLTDELRDYLEVAYVALADYVDDEMVRLMREYRRDAERVADGVRPAREKMASPAWTRMAETSRLAAEIAKSIADESAALRREFQTFASRPA